MGETVKRSGRRDDDKRRQEVYLGIYIISHLIYITFLYIPHKDGNNKDINNPL